MLCVACGMENQADARACINCGASLVTPCRSCGGQLPPLARFCPFCGQAAQGPAIPAAETPKNGAKNPERRQVTVFFADFAGFTAFADQHDVEDVREYLTSIWSRLDEILVAHGGRVEKHIGDAVMAVFGAEQAREDDPVQAVRAGLAMQTFVSQWRPPGPQPALQMRVGIHTGLVILGPLGSSGEFAAIGDTVNLASRLEQMAPIGTVLVSHDTYRQVYGFFDVQALAPASVKGKAEPVRAYVVLRAKPLALAMQLRGVEGVQMPMIGRQPELQRLKTLLQGVIAGRQARSLTVLGEAGIGKSCLLREFQEWIELLPENIRLFWGRARAETTGLPFALVRDMFSARCGIQESDSPALAREKLERGLLELLGPGALAGGSEHEEALLQIHFIGQLLGFDYSDSPFLKEILKDSDQVRARAFHYLARFLKAVSSSPYRAGASQVHATLIVAEDVHWSDDGSLDLFEYLARTWPDGPLLMICLSRPALLERRPGWGEGPAGHERLELGPLSRDESRTLVESILRKAPAVPQALRELIVGSAEGIPFYIEEIINMLIDQKVIRPGPDQWEIEPTLLAAVRVPPTLAGILQARLDGLTPSERLVLQCASVLGRIFWDNAVEQLCSPDEAPVGTPPNGHAVRAETLDALGGLRNKGLIVRREASAFAGAVEYSFRHELLRHVTYESLLKKSRRQHHARAAAWLIERSGSRVEEVSGLVALHFEHAGKQAEAADWFGRAGQQARRSYAPAQAIDYFRKALALLPGVPLPSGPLQAKQLDWWEGLIEVLGAQARFDEALEVCSRLQSLAQGRGDVLREARAWVASAFLQERLGKNRASIECADRAEALARTAGAAGQPELLRALHLKGWACYRLGDAPAVLELADQTRTLCRESGNRPGLATTCKLYGVAHLQLGHYDDADKFFHQGLTLCEQSGDRRNAAAMFSNLGESARSRGDFQAAAELYQKALAMARQIGHRESEIIYLTNLGAARLGLGQLEQAEAEVRHAIALAGPKFCALPESYSLLSQACLGQDKLAEALEAGRHALTLAQEAENDLSIGLAWRALGMVAAALGATSGPAHNGAPAGGLDPRACFAESLRVLNAIHAEGEQAYTLRAWADFELHHGSAEEGRRKCEAARSLFLRIGATVEAARLPCRALPG